MRSIVPDLSEKIMACMTELTNISMEKNCIENTPNYRY